MDKQKHFNIFLYINSRSECANPTTTTTSSRSTSARCFSICYPQFGSLR